MTVSTPDIQALIEEANIHRLSVGPNMGIVAADGIHGTPIGDVLAAECDLVQRLAAALSALSGETETEWEAGCRSAVHRRYGSGVAMVLDPLVRPDEHGEECPSPALVRRRKAGPWIEVTK